MVAMVTCIDIYGKEHVVPVSELQWRPAAYGIVIKDNNVLLSKQFGKYDLPGGGVELSEKLEEGVMREVKEETGLDVQHPVAIGIENNFFQSAHSVENKSYHSVSIYYVCEYIGGELSIDGFGEDEKEYAEIAEWVPLEKLDEIEIASTIDFRRYIKQAVQL
jgi:8-oxo-dGTP diphosphatase